MLYLSQGFSFCHTPLVKCCNPQTCRFSTFWLFLCSLPPESETQVRKNSVMMLDMRGMLSERSQDNPFDIFLSEDETTYGLDDILSSIQKAKENENIKGIYLQAGSMGIGFASLEEIRKALADFKTSGKFVIAYGDQYSQRLYYLASVADKVLLNPQGAIGWYGLASTPTFYKDLLSKIGVEMQVFKVGTYKSAVEPFISTEMSPANREQVTVFHKGIGGIEHQHFVGNLVQLLFAYAS